MCVTAELTDWVLFTPSSMVQEIRPFVQQMKQVGAQQNFHMNEPNL